MESLQASFAMLSILIPISIFIVIAWVIRNK